MSSKSGDKSGKTSKKIAKVESPASSVGSMSSSPSQSPPIPDRMVRKRDDGTGKFKTPVRFELDEVYTYGVTNGKFGGYSIPLKLDEECPKTELLFDVARRNGATLRLYGADETILYFETDQLTGKQTDDLLAKGAAIVKIVYNVVGTRKKKNGESALRFEVVGVKKVTDSDKTKGKAPVDLD